MMSIWNNLFRMPSLQWLGSQKGIDIVQNVPDDDDDVLAEQKLVHSGNRGEDRIVVKNLSKVYDDGKIAVDNLSIGIAPGECFGLLGINGN
jgi:ATP-binding cassette, subfamily A (ABC1), member 3